MVGIDFQIMTRLLAVSATARIVPSVATAVGRRNPVCVMWKVGAGEIRLAQDHAGLSDAHRAARNIRLDRIERPRKGLRGKQQDAIVQRREAGAVGIGHEQGSIGKGHAAHPPSSVSDAPGCWCGKGGLTNDQPRTLTGDEIGGQAHTGTQ